MSSKEKKKKFRTNKSSLKCSCFCVHLFKSSNTISMREASAGMCMMHSLRQKMCAEKARDERQRQQGS